MPEEFESGYQTTEQVETPGVQQEQVEQSPPQDEFDLIKYNKEEVQIPVTDRQKYLQQGYYYENKVAPELDSLKQQTQYLDRMAKISGYETTEELFEAIEQAEQEAERQRYADAGIDEETFNRLLESHPDVQFARTMRSEQETQQRAMQEVHELLDEFPELAGKELPQEVIDLQSQRGLSLLDAYLRVNYKTLAQQKEQDAIQKLQQNQFTSPGSLSGGDVSHKTNVSSMGSQDFNSLVDKVLRGEIKNL